MQPPAHELLIQHEGFIRSLAWAILRDEHASEDAAQETWLAALRSPHSQPRTFRAWLATLTRNIARDARRRAEVRAKHEALAAKNVNNSSITTILEREAVRRQVVDALASLPEAYQTVILLKYYEGLPPRAIAKKLDIPVETARTRLKRALELLRARLVAPGTGAHALSVLVMLAPSPQQIILNKIATVMAFSTKSKYIVSTVAALLMVFAAWLFINNSTSPKMDEKVLLAGALPDETARDITIAQTATAPSAAEPKREEISNKIDAPIEESKFGSLLLHIKYSDGSPAAGVAVRRQSERYGRLFIPIERANENGDFYISGVPKGSLSLVFDRARAKRFEIEEGKQREDMFTFEQGVNVEGKVVDANGAAVEGADIHLWDRDQGFGEVVVTKSGSGGLFKIRDVGGYPYCLFATKAPFAPSAGKVADSEVTLVLDSDGGRLIGDIRNEKGEPVEGAAAVLFDNKRLSASRRHGSPEIAVRTPHTTTKTGGTFIIDCAPIGAQSLYIQARGYALWKQKVNIVNGINEPLNIILQKEVVLTGTAKDAQGNISERGNVQTANTLFLDHFSAQIDKKTGSYRIAGLPAAEFTMVVRDLKLGSARKTFNPSPGEQLHWDVILSLGQVLAGRVVDEQGDPVSRYRITADPNYIDSFAINPGGQCHTDADGKFRIINCPEEPMRVTVYLPGGSGQAVKSMMNVRAGAGELKIIIKSNIMPNVTIKGVVLDSDQKPMKGASVSARRVGSFLGADGNMQSTGAFQIPNLIPGEYYLSVTSPAVGEWVSPVYTLKSGEVLDVGTLNIPKAGTLIVSVRMEGGMRLSESPFFIDDPARISVKHVDRDGDRFLPLLLPPGKYTLLYHDWTPVNAGASLNIPFEIKSGEDTRLDITIRPGAPRAFDFTLPKGVEPRDDGLEDSRLIITDRAGTIVYDSIVSWTEKRMSFYFRGAFLPGGYHYEVKTGRGFSASGDFIIDTVAGAQVTIASQLK